MLQGRSEGVYQYAVTFEWVQYLCVRGGGINGTRLYCESGIIVNQTLLWTRLYCEPGFIVALLWTRLYFEPGFIVALLWTRLYCEPGFILNQALLWTRLYCEPDIIVNQCEPGFIVCSLTILCSPMMESKAVRYSLVARQEAVLGRTRAFDGSTLYLPNKITETTLTLSAVRDTDDTPVSVFITLVAVVNYSNCVQLFNVIFRRVCVCVRVYVRACVMSDPAGPTSLGVAASWTSLLRSLQSNSYTTT